MNKFLKLPISQKVLTVEPNYQEINKARKKEAFMAVWALDMARQAVKLDTEQKAKKYLSNEN